ncbi:MAG: hypothetical protein F4X31_07485 [Gammaproteobacteria bacterium]|nr:hypothetical protein [Gammaproteobacteria bacterium]MYH16100.1 hypothetical protein [Gammaproteobacteria bacterium]
MTNRLLAQVMIAIAGLWISSGSVLAQKHLLPLFLSASNTSQHSASSVRQESFVRIINHSDEEALVVIEGYDDAGEYSYAELLLGAKRTVHLNSEDVENGNAEKNLPIGLGPSTKGHWRLHLFARGKQHIEPAAYIRTRPDGFLTSMSAVAPFSNRGKRHGVSIFNPASNVNQRSWLRLVNMAYDDAEITISGVDDAGVPAPGGVVRLSLPRDQAVALTSEALESGISDDIELTGSLGEKLASGKWQLEVVSDQPIIVMSLLDTPTGHLSNLSAPKPDYRSPVGLWEVGFEDGLTGGYLVFAPDNRLHGWVPETDLVRVLDGEASEWSYDELAGSGLAYVSGTLVADDIDLRPVDGAGQALGLRAEYRADDWMRGPIFIDHDGEPHVRELFGSALNGFDRGADLMSLAGTWTADEGDFSLSVESEGEFNGSLQVGDFDCELSGVLTDVHPALALYRSAMRANCTPADKNLEMTLAVVDRPNAPGLGDRALVFVVASDKRGAVGVALTRQLSP